MIKTIQIVTGVTAALCVLVLPMWALGVPGVDGNNYARGWKMGLAAILIYPVAWVGALVLYFLARRFLAQNENIPTIHATFCALAFVALVARLVQAFRIMS